MPFAIEVIGFADEEGVRFASTLLGSRAVAGTFDESVLGTRDRAGISMREALAQFGLDPDHIGAAARARSELHAYVELHIEQGPVLERKPAGRRRDRDIRRHAPRGEFDRHGRPCRHRADGAAARRAGGRRRMYRRDRGVLPDRQGGLVGTVGSIDAMPGATNVIPGRCPFTIDMRAASDAHRKMSGHRYRPADRTIAKRRELALQVDVTHENRTVPCAPWLKEQVAEAIAAEGFRVFELPSGAGHDGMAMIDIADVAMVFVRCRGGISHHPDEHVDAADADAGARVLLRLIENFRPRNSSKVRKP